MPGCGACQQAFETEVSVSVKRARWDTGHVHWHTYLLVQELQIGCAVIFALGGGLLLFVLAPVPVRLFIIPLIVAFVIAVCPTLELEIILQGLLAVLNVVS